jgi:lysophospholipase
MITVQGAKHEVLFEKDEYRNQAMDAIRHFFSAEKR